MIGNDVRGRKTREYRKRKSAPCWCKCVCHDNSWKLDVSHTHGDLIHGKATRAGRCGSCRTECNRPRREDYPA